MSNDVLSVAVADGVAVITLDRPDKLNALTPPMMSALGAALDEIVRTLFHYPGRYDRWISASCCRPARLPPRTLNEMFGNRTVCGIGRGDSGDSVIPAVNPAGLALW